MYLPKLYISPINSVIFDAIDSLHLNDIGYILSQRQHHLRDGYMSLDVKMLSNTVLERDHFSPDFNDFSEPIKYDAQLFHIIHLDLWHNSTYSLDNLKKVMGEFLNFNPDMIFEFGTEDYVKKLEISELENIFEWLPRDYLSKITYLVAQGGSVVFDLKNISPIDIDTTSQYVKLAKTFDMKVKRHNCDFHTEDELILLKNLGVEAYNFAPEFSVIYNQNIYENLKYNDIHVLHEAILKTPWNRWIDSVENKPKLYKACLHYIQDPIIDETLTDNLKKKIKKEIQQKVYQILDCIN